MDWRIQLFQLNYDEHEYNAVREVLDSSWLTMGQKTIDFEEAYAKFLGEGSKCVAVSNGTAALHIAVLAAGVGSGDEVIVPSLTFIADLNSVRVTGADVVLADITSQDDWAMDPVDIEKKITPKTKAILIVHYAGYSCNMDAILAICKKYSLKLIEDCAHAPGGEYAGRKLGTFGDLAAWSFFSNKNLSVGEGGMVATRDQALYIKCKNLRSHGMTTASFDRIKGRAVTYDVLEPGFNYRIDEIRSALGLVQLGKLNKANARRKELTNQYFQHLVKIPGVVLPFKDFTRGVATYHIMPIMLPENVDRTKVIELMKDDKIQTSIHYPAIQTFTAYKDCVVPTPKAEFVSEHELTLPLYPTMQDGDVDLVCSSLARAIQSSTVS